MALQCDQYATVLLVTVQGDLGAEEAAALRSALSSRADRNIVVDLQACRFLSSVGLESLLDALRACESRGGRLTLAGPDDNCRRILEFTRLDHRFECHRAVASALKVV